MTHSGKKVTSYIGAVWKRPQVNSGVHTDQSLHLLREVIYTTTHSWHYSSEQLIVSVTKVTWSSEEKSITHWAHQAGNNPELYFLSWHGFPGCTNGLLAGCSMLYLIPQVGIFSSLQQNQVMLTLEISKSQGQSVAKKLAQYGADSKVNFMKKKKVSV